MSHRIVVYSSDEAQPSERFIAYIALPAKTRKGEATEHRIGINFPAADSDTARANAEAYWQAEIDREHRKLIAAEKRGEALAEYREARALSRATPDIEPEARS